MIVPGLLGTEHPYPLVKFILLIAFPANNPIELIDQFTIPMAADISSLYNPPADKDVKDIPLLVIVNKEFNALSFKLHLRMDI